MSTVTDALENVLVPLHKLSAWDGNVRRTRPDARIPELAVSIRAVGLLENLVIRKASKTKYHVVAGKRRLQALLHLLEEGAIERDFPVPCRVLPKDSDLIEVSLAENVQHEALHPADEFEAFYQLIESGHSAADVAARFGVTEAVVQKRLALARVSPALLEKYRAGDMTLELLQAFTISDDRAAQEQAWQQLQQHWNPRDPRLLRQMLSHDDVPASDKRARFVTITAYEAAGGALKRDLFADDSRGEGVFLRDIPLLTRLVNEKLGALASELQSDGWKWIEVQQDNDHRSLGKYRRVHAKPLPLTDEQNAQLEALERQQAQIREELSDTDEEDESEASQQLYRQLDGIESEIATIRKARQYDFPQEIKAAAGAVVSIGHHGEPDITYGLVRKEDESAFAQGRSDAEQTNNSPAASAEAGETEEKRGGAYSAALIEDLTTYKTAAIAADMCANQHIGLAAVVYTLAVKEFTFDLRISGTKTCLQVAPTRPKLDRGKGSPALAFLEEQRSGWLTQLPDNPADLWNWCVEQEERTLLRLLSFLGAASVNAICAKHDPEASARAAHADALAASLGLNMSRWFQPTAENFFDRISKAKIVECLKEGGKEAGPVRQALKKAELAKIAEYDLTQTGWLPEPLRPCHEFRQQLNGRMYEEPLEEAELETGGEE